MDIKSSKHDFHMDPRMADTVAAYIQTLMNNLESDPRMEGFLSEDDMNVLREAHNIALDVADAVRNPSKWW